MSNLQKRKTRYYLRHDGKKIIIKTLKVIALLFLLNFLRVISR